MRLAPIFLTAALFSTPAFAGDPYTFDPGHTQVRAEWNHAGFSTQALHFRAVEGTAVIDFEDPAKTRLNVVIPVEGIDSGVAAFDKHLRSGDFFEVDAHPNATFVSTSVEKTGDATLTVIGDLTIRGVSRPVTLDVTVNSRGAHPLGQFIDYFKGDWVGVTATGRILRSEWGLGFGAPITSDEVDLFISTEMKKTGS